MMKSNGHRITNGNQIRKPRFPGSRTRTSITSGGSIAFIAAAFPQPRRR